MIMEIVFWFVAGAFFMYVFLFLLSYNTNFACPS